MYHTFIVRVWPPMDQKFGQSTKKHVKGTCISACYCYFKVLDFEKASEFNGHITDQN